MTGQQIRDHLLKAGVHNLKEYGYPSVTAENILTDMVYSSFFRAMLYDNKGHSPAFDVEIKKLLLEMDR